MGEAVQVTRLDMCEGGAAHHTLGPARGPGLTLHSRMQGLIHHAPRTRT